MAVADVSLMNSSAYGGETTQTAHHYTYDDLYRLTEAATPAGEYDYTYDAAGNRTAATAINDTRTYTYDNADHITTAYYAPVTVHPVYDNRGNLLYDGTFTYTYDGAGRMVKAESITTTAVYTYNGDGLRVAQAINGAVTTFTWDQALDLPQVLATSDGVKHLYGLERVGVQ